MHAIVELECRTWIGGLELLTENAENTKVVIAPRCLGLKLDFGSGDNPKIGFDGVDLFASKAKWRQNLFTFPWPWGDEQVAEIHCSHFIEHIPMTYVTNDVEFSEVPTSENSMDLFLKFFEECYRILTPGGKMTCIWPNNKSDRAFQDPTHRRFIPPMFVAYLNRNWRNSNGLGHYLGSCNFTDGNNGLSVVTPLFPPPDFALFSEEAAQRRMMENWNTFLDYQAVLIKQKD